jgi:hypothetical protein
MSLIHRYSGNAAKWHGTATDMREADIASAIAAFSPVSFEPTTSRALVICWPRPNARLLRRTVRPRTFANAPSPLLRRPDDHRRNLGRRAPCALAIASLSLARRPIKRAAVRRRATETGSDQRRRQHHPTFAGQRSRLSMNRAAGMGATTWNGSWPWSGKLTDLLTTLANSPKAPR